MGFPESVLTSDEEIAAHLHPHWITLVPASCWLVIVCVAAGVGLAFLPVNGPQLSMVAAVLVVALVLLTWLTFIPWIRWRSTHYVFTTERVLVRRGVLRHTGHDIALTRINDVGFVLSLWDRMVGAGTLTIESAGELGQERLVNVPHAARVQQTLNRLIEDDAERHHRYY